MRLVKKRYYTCRFWTMMVEFNLSRRISFRNNHGFPPKQVEKVRESSFPCNAMLSDQENSIYINHLQYEFLIYISHLRFAYTFSISRTLSSSSASVSKSGFGTLSSLFFSSPSPSFSFSPSFTSFITSSASRANLHFLLMIDPYL